MANKKDRKKTFIHMSNSFIESDKFMMNYYNSLTWEEKLDICQYLREQYYKVRGISIKRMDKKNVHIIKNNL